MAWAKAQVGKVITLPGRGPVLQGSPVWKNARAGTGALCSPDYPGWAYRVLDPSVRSIGTNYLALPGWVRELTRPTYMYPLGLLTYKPYGRAEELETVVAAAHYLPHRHRYNDIQPVGLVGARPLRNLHRQVIV